VVSLNGRVLLQGRSTVHQRVEALWTSDRRRLESFVSVQPEYNLLDPIRGLVEMELDKNLPLDAIARLDDASEFLGGCHSADDDVS
jgi:hypothetical protein